MTDDASCKASPLTEGLGLTPERAAFEAWAMSEWGRLEGVPDAAWLGFRAAHRMQQARIDALMLEHCPDEMTPEQMAEWAKHQVVAPGFDEAALDAALKA